MPRPFTQPRWQGEKLNGSLLVWGEQGIGDEILHAANLGPLSEAVPAVVWESDPRLVSLLARSYPRVRFAARQTPPVALTADPAITAQIPAGSLALHVAAPQRPYLKGDPVRTRELRARLLTPGKSRLIGISWISKNAAFGALKTCALADLARLWQAAGPAAQFVDLQYGDTRAERTAAGLDLAHLDDLDLTHDIDGLAALVAACDNVVTVSNTTAHLAGALGIPVKVLVSTGSGKLWYWGHGPAGSARYASAEVIRQSVANRWDDVIARAGASIAAGA